MANRKIIFIRKWGNYKVGDVMENPTDVTIRELCFKHKFGRLEGDPAFEERIQLQKLTMTKLAQDIAFGVKHAESDISGIVEDLDKKLATPTPSETQIREKRTTGSRKRRSSGSKRTSRTKGS